MVIESRIDKIFQCLSKVNPHPKTELNYSNDFTLLVAIVLSAQSTDIGVNRVTSSLFKEVSTPQDIINLGINQLKDYIKSLGLFNNKAKNIMSLAKMLIDKFQNNIPLELGQLEGLPGVGSKTARVFLNCAHNVPIIAVDTHVFRVSKRLGIAKGSTAKLVEKELNLIIPDKWKLHAHHWLILHGRYICKARSPDCNSCLVKQYCNYYNKI